jgi:hypothetical protein
MITLRMSKGGAILILGLVLSIILFGCAWIEYWGIRQSEIVHQALSEFEVCIFHLRRNGVENQTPEEQWQHVLRCKQELNQLTETSPTPLRSIWKDIEASIPDVMPEEGLPFFQKERHQELHQMRNWMEQKQISRLKHLGILLLGGTGLLLALLTAGALLLRRASYRAAYPLPGLVPICASCHCIRDENQKWRKVDAYLHYRLGTRFTHSFCPDCLNKHLEDLESSR